MKTILLIGVGQLGCRHLEGLVTSSTPLVIHAVDMSLESINLAKSRWQSFGEKTNNHKIFWNNTLPCNLDFFDVCIISSTSTKRASLVQQISKCYLVNYWILEKVLAQSSGELSHIESILMNAKGAWVNTPWRSMLLYKSLKKAINGNYPLKISFSGSDLGIACNSIHFIDLTTWMSGESLLLIDTSLVDNSWFESKRKGYFDVCGKLTAKFSGGTLLEIADYNDNRKWLLKFELADKSNWEFDYSKSRAVSSNGDIILGKVDFQSQMTGPLVEEILQCGQCDLPSLKESIAIHTIFVESMLKHWNKSNNREDCFVPIT